MLISKNIEYFILLIFAVLLMTFNNQEKKYNNVMCTKILNFILYL